MELGLLIILASIPPIVLIIFIVFLITIIMIININMVKIIRSFQHPDDLITQIDKINDIKFNSFLLKYEYWINENQFVQDCFYQTKVRQAATKDAVVTVPDNSAVIKTAVWWSEKDKTGILIYYSNIANIINFFTRYSDSISIETCSFKDSIMLPGPSQNYIQAFTKLEISELYQKHLEARKIVENHECVFLPSKKVELMDSLKPAIKRQSDYIMSLPFWYFRGVYWFFIRRNFLVNKPIKINKP